MNNSPAHDDQERRTLERELKRTFGIKVSWIGICSLLLSTLFLIFAAFFERSGSLSGGSWLLALSLMIARTAGIAAFMSGVAMIFLERWTMGTLLIIASTVLPCLAFLVFGTI